MNAIPSIKIRITVTAPPAGRQANPGHPINLAGESSPDRDRHALMLGRLFVEWLEKSGGDYDNAADVVAGVARRIDNMRAGRQWREGTGAAAKNAKTAKR